jgi:glycopeptide antibiotics resistance protein
MFTVQKESLVNLIPLENEVESYKALTRYNSREAFNFYSNLIGNVLLFMPFPWLTLSLNRRFAWRAIILSALFMSLSIEFTQYIFKIGVADIDDVILNTAGSMVGLSMYKPMIRTYNNRKQVD